MLIKVRTKKMNAATKLLPPPWPDRANQLKLTARYLWHYRNEQVPEDDCQFLIERFHRYAQRHPEAYPHMRWVFVYCFPPWEGAELFERLFEWEYPIAE